jgi:ureidoacrylate peracid hydrolase
MTLSTSAVVVVDMQNGFCSEGGSLAGDAEQRARYASLVPPIRRLCGQARESGLLVVYTRHGYRAGYPEMGSELRTLHPEVVATGGMRWGTWDTRVVDGLTPPESDPIVRKSRFDAFLGTDLELLLQGVGVTEVILVGISTNVCVESTARTAAQRGYRVSVAADATAATTPQLHESALTSLAYAFGRVAPWRDLLVEPDRRP